MLLSNNRIDVLSVYSSLPFWSNKYCNMLNGTGEIIYNLFKFCVMIRCRIYVINVLSFWYELIIIYRILVKKAVHV